MKKRRGENSTIEHVKKKLNLTRSNCFRDFTFNTNFGTK